MNFLRLFSLLIFLPFWVFARNQSTALPQPFSFIENKGQLTDQHGAPRPDIDFMLRGPNVTVFIGDGQISYLFNKESYKQREHMAGSIGQFSPKEIDKTETYRMDMVLEGANPNARLVTFDDRPYYETYYKPSCPQGAVAHAYGKLIYTDIYPNIDWVLYQSEEGSLKYDFVVHPGGNPADIKLRYNGATELKIVNGALIAQTPLGMVTEQKPYSYQQETKEEVTSSFVLRDNILSFDLAPHSGTLVIDPVLNWGTYFGGSAFTVTVKVMADAAGNAFLAGYTRNTTLATFGSYQYVHAGDEDCFIAKIGKNGFLQWCTYYGGDSTDLPYAFVPDGLGNMYLAGHTVDTSGLFAPTGAHQERNGGNGRNGQTLVDGFIAKFNAAGSRVWGTYLGGYFNDYIHAMNLDDSGNVYVGGYTESPTNISTPGTFRPLFGGPILGSSSEGYLVKFSAAGVRRWGTYYMGRIGAITCDRLGNVITGGLAASSSANISTSGAHQLAFAGGASDGHVTKFNGGNGGKIWGTFYGGTDMDDITSIACDSVNNIYVGGYSMSNAGISTTGSFKPVRTPSVQYPDAFLIKMTSNGVRQWGTYYGNSYTEFFREIKVSTDGYLYCTGPMSTPSFIPQAMLLKFDTAGKREWDLYYGGDDAESNASIAITHGKVYLAGNTASTNNIATTGAMQTVLSDPNIPISFLAQFEADTNLFLNVNHTDTTLCLGDTTYLDYHTTNKYGPANTFTVQLSDASGSFVTPVNVGARIFDSSGAIAYVIPDTTTPGTGYRLRVISSSFPDTTQNNGVNIRISAYPDAGPVAISPICANGTLQMLDSASGTPSDATYEWTGPGGFSITTAQYNRPNVQVTDSGYYYLTVDVHGCKNTDSTHVIITPKPAKPVFTTNSPVCLGDTLKVIGASATPGVQAYNKALYHGGSVTPVWYVPDGTGDTLIPVSKFTDSGSYVMVAILNGCPSDPETTKVVVRPTVIPSIQISATNGGKIGPWQGISFNVTTQANEGNNPTYQWLKNGTDIPGATSQNFMGTTGMDLNTGDTICIRLTSSAACAVPVEVYSCIGIEIDLSVPDYDNAVTLRTYPNPTAGGFVMETNESGTLQVSDMQGRVVSKHALRKGENTVVLPGGLADGVYIGRFGGEGGMTRQLRIILQR